MHPDESCEAFIDGASSGNPGPSAYAYIIKRGGEALRGNGYLGPGTNNQAEYEALVHCLRRALRLGCRNIIVYSDSTLLVKQLRGEYNVREQRLRRLREEALNLINNFDSFEIRHIPRELNSEANNLARRGLRKAARVGGGVD
ncbi:MAG: ribonuclease HI family protein [Nitrososphaerota archaeon]|nr:ribonuclease HI family protein [Candidatus Calditenuaceae archaeon]MDW8072769.1 ribonuclease HI family protein [Nitrososphaerota archaeon]